MKRTSAKVGDQVRVHTTIPRKYGKGRRKTIAYDGIIHEISYKKNNNPHQSLFKNGYVMLSGKFVFCISGRWVRSTKRKISLDCIRKVMVKREVATV